MFLLLKMWLYIVVGVNFWFVSVGVSYKIDNGFMVCIEVLLRVGSV